MPLSIHSRNSEACEFMSITCVILLNAMEQSKYEFIEHVKWHCSFNQVLTLSEKLAEEEITIWNQSRCLL